MQFHAVLYIPDKPPFDLFQKERTSLRLYAKRVLIMESCDKLTPSWLRFLRGVVDSEDLTLNVSRETLQESRTLAQIEQQLVKQVLKTLKELAESDAARYLRFWKTFGKVLKEGATNDFKHRDAIIELALTAMLRVAERAAVFVVRREHFHGWVCNPAFGAEEQLREVAVPQRVPSVLATAVAAGYYLGPIPGTSAHGSLIGVMGHASREVSVVVARVAGRPALLLLADELDDTLLGTRAMGEVAGHVGAALERVLLRKA